MKTATPDKSLTYRDVFASGQAEEKSWARYAAKRESALAAVLDRGLETRGLEEWVHGKAAGLVAGDALPVRGEVAAAGSPEMARVAGSHLLVFVNGVFDPARSEIGTLPAGASVQPLSAGDEAADLGSVARDVESSFTALNSLFWRDGLQLILADGVVLEQPVELWFVNDLAGEAGLIPVRNLIQVGAGSEATIIERFVLGQAAVVEQPLTEVVCAAGSVVNHIKLVGGEAAGEHFGSTHVVQRADSTYRSWEIVTGGHLARRELHLDLTESGAKCDLNALYMGAGKQRFDLRTRVNHDAAECETRELYKGILDGEARGVFDGLILVARDSQQTSAHQTNRNLLLSDDAVANSIPRLEIYADDVKCSHGSTTGQLEDEALFYLRTRGFSPEEARTYLAWAFASEVIESIPVLELRAELSAVVTRTLDVVDDTLMGELS